MKHSTSLQLLSWLHGVLLLALIWSSAPAQSLIRGIPTDVWDPRSVFANPALVSFQRPALAAGVKVYHVGLGGSQGTPFKQGFFSLAGPNVFGEFGLGISGQYFQSPMLNRALFGVRVSRRLFRHLSLGVSASAYVLSYNTSSFDLVDEDDPVFRSGAEKLTLTTSAGLLFVPFGGFTLAVGGRNLNQPNLSLIGDSVHQPVLPFAAAAVSLGPFQATVTAEKHPERVETRVFLEAFETGGNFVRLGSGLSGVTAEAQLHVTGPLSINYSYELPLTQLRGASSGSHMATLIFDFSRLASLPPRVIPPGRVFRMKPPGELPPPTPRIFVWMREAEVDVYEKRIVRYIDPHISASSVSKLTAYDIGVLDSSFAQVEPPFQPQPIKVETAPPPMGKMLSSSYRETLDRLRALFAQRPDLKVELLTREGAVYRAAQLRAALAGGKEQPEQRLIVAQTRFTDPADSVRFFSPVRPASVAPQEKLIFTRPERVTIEFLPIFLEDGVASWRLEVKDDNGNTVRRFAGGSALPQELSWDWRGDDGQVLEAGTYRYYLTWTDRVGGTHRSPEMSFYVRKFVRTIHVEVTRDPARLNPQVSNISIYVNK